MIPMKEGRMNSENKNESEPRSAFVFWLPVTGLVLIDQLTKFLAFHNKVHFFWTVLDSVLGFTIKSYNFKNYYFAFSIRLPEYVIFFIYGVVLFLITRYISDHYQEFSKRDLLAWVLIVAGALSNIGERLVLGYVRDFVSIATGIFNVADFYIILGIILLLIPKSYKLKPKS